MNARKVMDRAALATAAGVVLGAGLFCTRCALHHFGPERTAAAHPHQAPVDLPPVALSAPRAGEHRVLLDADAILRLRESARRGTDAWKAVVAGADEALAHPIPSGYQGFAWADALADASLAWHGSGDPRYAAEAVSYLRALLDDRLTVGDGQGGENVVTHDSGYGIRTFGAYTTLGYDWLRDAPGMDAALRAHALERLAQWLAWYGRSGYLRDRPTANYYWGYLTTLSFAGLAAAGESLAADKWLAQARDAFSTDVIPTFRSDLAGGGWAEGWQYGEYTAVEVSLVARAFAMGAQLDLVKRLPWISEMVTYHVHALLPDGASVYDGGTWGEHPAKPGAAALAAAAVALDGDDDAHAAEARWMMAHALPPLHREQAWVGLLADKQGAPERAPREGAPTSYHVPGLGLSFMRSDWTRNAVWVSFQAGPPVAEDHQHADQGHFELFRGGDALLVDGGDSEGSATINHNTLLIDDGGSILNYPPNQGVWGTKVRTTRFGDDGVAAVVVGDIGEAYAPSCAEDGCTKRAVKKAVRTLAFLRPNVVVIDDEVELDKPDYDVTWAAHVTTAPTIAGTLSTAVVGQSRVDVRTLEPVEAQAVARREPTPSGEGSHRSDHPWGPMWRVEVPSPRGSRERTFLHFITTDRSAAQAPAVERVSGDGIKGAVGMVDGRRVGVLFVGAKKRGRVTLGAGEADVVVVGLDPAAHYTVNVVPGGACVVEVAPASDGAGLVAGPGGFVRVHLDACRQP